MNSNGIFMISLIGFIWKSCYEIPLTWRKVCWWDRENWQEFSEEISLIWIYVHWHTPHSVMLQKQMRRKPYWWKNSWKKNSWKQDIYILSLIWWPDKIFGWSCYKQSLIIAWIFGLNFYNMDHCALLAHATQRNATKTNEKKTIWCGWSWPCKHRVYAVAYYIQS